MAFFPNSTGRDTHLAVCFEQACSVAHEAASLDELTQIVDRGYSTLCDGGDKLHDGSQKERQHRPAARPLAVRQGWSRLPRLCVILCRKDKQVAFPGDALLFNGLGFLSSALVLWIDQGANVEACGTRTSRSSRRFLPRSVVRTLIPVALRLGRFRLSTSPSTGNQGRVTLVPRCF